ncbi:hypothetical protein EOA51_31925, partial [Mesorhizobium sp. M1A.F.Ca.IN.020.32.1.1]|uniref:hypothetical protein n=1 Tax=Mesorhizobium sp. M1A.F.Ca.IN.020.32.1.1 TaxID=2496763 RepID=UPI000FD47BA2
MLWVVKPFDKEDETPLQGGRKPCHTLSQSTQCRSAMHGVVKSLGEEDQTLLQGGRKPSRGRSET